MRKFSFEVCSEILIETHTINVYNYVRDITRITYVKGGNKVSGQLKKIQIELKT